MLKELEIKRLEKEEEIKFKNNRHKEEIDKLQNELKGIVTSIKLYTNNIDEDKLNIAKTILNIEGIKWLGSGDTKTKVKEAIEDVINDFVKLRREYFGAKNYDRWTCQGCNCNYGYSPSHGSIVFKIGMKDITRKRNDITDEEIDCCLYYLNNLDKLATIQ